MPSKDLNRIYGLVDKLSLEFDGEFSRRKNHIAVELNWNSRKDTVRGRKQKILIGRKENLLTMKSVVVKLNDSHQLLSKVSKLKREIWRRNGLVPIVSFSIDSRQRIVGTISILYSTVSKSDLVFYLRTLARECDRFEYVLTLTDIH